MTYPDPSTPAYPQAVYPQTLVVPTSGKATAALILGLAAIITCGSTGLAAIITCGSTGPAAVVLGHLAWGDTASGRRGGHGSTVAGLVLGYLTTLPLIAVAVFAVLPAALGGSAGQ